MNLDITGHTAAEIADSVRSLVDAGDLPPGSPLPPVRRLAEHLSVNRNTVVAAYGQLTQARVAVTRGRSGTTIAAPSVTASEGFAPHASLPDIGSGNPSAAYLPDVGKAMLSVPVAPTLYGGPPSSTDLAQCTYESITGTDHQRWALIRSVSKFLGPDLRLALVAGDPATTARLGRRINVGTTWVSHLLQQLAYIVLHDPDSRATINAAARHYAAQRASFVVLLNQRGIDATSGDGVNAALALSISSVSSWPAKEVIS